MIGSQDVEEQFSRVAFKLTENVGWEFVVGGAERRDPSRVGEAEPRGSGEPRGLRVFFPGLGGLRLAHVVDCTREPFQAKEVINLLAGEFGPIRLRLVFHVSERDERVLVEVSRTCRAPQRFPAPA